MHLKSLALRQFRSYKELDLIVDPGVNLFLGMNGSGKTNLLEAIAVLTTGASPRGGDTESMVGWGLDGFYIRGEFAHDAETLDPMKLEMKYRLGSSRQIKQDGQKVIRLKDLIGHVPLVSFVPEDLAIIKGEPVLRRQSVNMILMQVDSVYASELKKYNDTIRFRNAALKQVAEGTLENAALEPWNNSLIKSGLIICQKRAEFIKDFSIRAAGVHKRISNGQETLSLEYKPSFAGPHGEDQYDRWNQKLASIRPQELALGMTMTGPHRDDFVFLLNGRAAKMFGSEGQKRTGAVSFKLAEIPYIHEKRGQKPICLLDDVLSELDAKRAAHLLDELSKTGQCFVTLTGLESWPKDHDLPASIFDVNASSVQQRKKIRREEPALTV